MRKEVILGLALALGSTGAFASFSSQDANSNGQISKDEFYGVVSDNGKFADWDLDNDGLIENGEFSKLDYDWDFDTWDANADGFLDSGEFYDGYYGTYDANEDGHWDEGEWDDAGENGLFDL